MVHLLMVIKIDAVMVAKPPTHMSGWSGEILSLLAWAAPQPWCCYLQTAALRKPFSPSSFLIELFPKCFSETKHTLSKALTS